DKSSYAETTLFIPIYSAETTLFIPIYFMSKKVFLKSWGCQMNVRDSEVVAGLLKRAGYSIVDNEASANVIIFNTCSVRRLAEDKVWSELGKYKDSRLCVKDNKPIIGVVGCMANNYQEDIFQKAPQVDFVIGTADIAKIPSVIKKLLPNTQSPTTNLFKTKIWETDANERPEEIYHTGFYEDKSHAFVVVSEGCENYCSYCVVPYVRGKLRSRNHQDILSEINEAVATGISEITLLGQNVNAYQYEAVDFIKLIKLVDSINGLKAFSFITSHPKDTSIDLFKAMSESGKLKKYLHLPAQSGSDKILELMNRGYNRKFYLDLVDNYRKIVQNAALTTDIIVGFPGETEKDFLDTYNLIKTVEFNAAYIFKYSVRPRASASNFPDDVPKEEKERRHALILNLQKEISRRKDRISQKI
ncbi:MAG: tRNA (N6-isopentenyl adenosine(37)-C2)-methylthiotransferase MiaB, partial [Candidatus Omnitrophota bacterium]|nr:tRNA (N6-isopentenyl adenosine(37)-C2)-methylthiotransferase MiaB [Candidatus Omnitrophota bacterium]